MSDKQQINEKTEISSVKAGEEDVVSGATEIKTLDRPKTLLGQHLEERYEVLELKGKGGMGAVYKAYDHKLNRIVALKGILEPTKQAAKDIALKEARTLAALNHPNILHIYDILNTPEQIWLVSEWLEGRTITELSLPLPIQCILAVMTQVYSALAAAHEAKVFHRDINPSNIMVNKNGKVTLIDFGVACSPGVSTGETMAGTLRYIDPRILEGKPADALSDLFSASLLQIELMTGQQVLPDLAPLPLYNHINTNLYAMVDELLLGHYPPLVILAKKFIDSSSRTKIKEKPINFAEESFQFAMDSYHELTKTSAEQYLANYFQVEASFNDPQVHQAILRKTDLSFNDTALAPKHRALWLSFSAKFDSTVKMSISKVKSPETPQKTKVKLTSRPLKKWEKLKYYFLYSMVFLIVAVTTFFISYNYSGLAKRELSMVLHNWFPAYFAGELLPQNPDKNQNPRVLPGTQVINKNLPDEKKTDNLEVATSGEKNSPVLPIEAKASDKLALTSKKIVKSKISFVKIVANVWVKVTVDDKAEGKLPRAQPFSLSPGNHVIKLENPYMEPLTKKLVVLDKPNQVFKFDLTPIKIKYTFHMKNPAQFFINDDDYGEVNEKTIVLPYGAYRLKLVRDGETVFEDEKFLGPQTPTQIYFD